MKKVMIIGAGFAGLSCARRLSCFGLELEVTLLDRKGDFNFLPLIPDCIGRQISPKFLANDLAEISRRLKVRFIRQEVDTVDLENNRVLTQQQAYVYDYLLIASGSQPNFFANFDAQSYSYPLNNISDVQKINGRLKEDNFQNVIICGAGYTGVEAATNLWRYFKKKGIFKKIIIVERSPAILGALPDWMKGYVARNLQKMGITVLVNSMIEKIFPDKLLVSGNREFASALLIWVPGVRTADFIQKLDIPKNPQGRIVADEYLRVKPNCFCVGDAAFVSRKDRSLRMAIQFAITQGDMAAKNIISSIKNTPLKKYRPLDLGYILPLANSFSCGQVLGINVSGPLATFLHFSMCVFRSKGWRNRWGLVGNLLKRGDKC